MKILMILWAIGLTKCDKLDRIYLPPPGSDAAAGYLEDFHVPLEFPKKNYPPILIPGNIRPTDDSSNISNYPNIAIGIDRQAPYTTTFPNFLAKRPTFPVSKSIYNKPTTTTSYDFTQKSTESPNENYGITVGPMTTLSQGYSSPTSLDASPSDEQYLIQQSINQNKPQEMLQNSISGDTLSKIQNNNIRQSITGFPIDHSGVQGEHFQHLQQNPTANNLNLERYDNKQTFEQAPKSFDSQQFPKNFDKSIVNSQDYYDFNKLGAPTTLAPGQTFIETSETTAAVPFPYYTTKDLPQRIHAEGDRNAVILNYKNILLPEGFAYSFDTSNGIHVDEKGTANNGVKAVGSFSFIGDDGKVYSIEYTADENGFVPRGNHLPTAPPIPEAILRGIEQAEKNKKLGIIDDGSYDDAKYGHGRYQGLINRIQQNKSHKIIDNKPEITESDKHGEKPIRKEEYLTNDFEDSDKTISKYDVEVTSDTPSDTYGSRNASYIVDNNKYFMPNFSDPNHNNKNLFNSETVKNININLTNEAQSKLKNIVIGDYKNDPQLILSIKNKSENSKKVIANENMFSPLNLNTKKEYSTDINQRKDTIKLDSGYEYTKPQNMFNDDDKISSESLLSTMGPKYASTTVNPYNYHSPDSKQNFNNYPVSNFKTQFSVSTTPLPSRSFSSSTPLAPEFSSPFTSSIGNIRYSQVTPTVSQVTSTLRPLKDSGSSEPTSRRPDTGNISSLAQSEDFKMSTMNPNHFDRSPGRPEYRGIPNKIPLTKGGFGGNLEPEFEKPKEPSSQNFEVSFQPEDFRDHLSTEKVIGEDFSGPKQPQQFDPKFGYYY